MRLVNLMLMCVSGASTFLWTIVGVCQESSRDDLGTRYDSDLGKMKWDEKGVYSESIIILSNGRMHVPIKLRL